MDCAEGERRQAQGLFILGQIDAAAAATPTGIFLYQSFSYYTTTTTTCFRPLDMH